MGKSKILCGLVLVCAHAAVAATITDVLPEQNIVMLESTGDEKIRFGDNLEVEAASGSCLLEVLRLTGTSVTTSSLNCAPKDALKKGALARSPRDVKTEAPAAVEAPPPPAAAKPAASPDDDHVRTFFLVGMGASQTIRLDTMYYAGTDYDSGWIEYTLKPSFSLGVEWNRFQADSWNHGFGVQYFRADFDKVTVHASTQGSLTSAMSSGDIGVFTASYAPNYRWQTFYIPVAIGLSGSSVTHNASLTKTIRTGLYTAVGIGFALNERFLLEMLSSSYVARADSVTEGSLTISPTTGFLSRFAFNLKFLF